jgi:hypothetical protein
MSAPRAFLLLVLASLATAACGSDSTPTAPVTGAVFQIRVGSESFRFLTRDPRVIADAEALVGKGPGRRILSGRLISGDGGVNSPWRWHLDPADAHFADATIELCDGRPSDIEADPNYWIGTVGRYCPWGTEVVSRIR